ncbi:MAG: hypothetical protein F4Z75_00940 [Synechococcus sp. SB0668_bin_15]|nr:hypothetical protein [Synechococcus sp. SB0668_bin_15]MYC49542.1 hypothetical protein [Synechococcus sp. SB0662_bin_14]
MSSPLPRHPVHGLGWRLLFTGLLLALLQQYALQRRPGRLLGVRPAVDAAAVLELRYSRPVDPASLAASIQLTPDVPLSITADGATVQLGLSQPYRASGPVEVSVGGRDQRSRPLRRVRLRWDPRPLLLGLVSSSQGQRLELAWPDAGGAWQPITPWESSISNVLPLRDGRGVVYAAAVDSLSQRNWFVEVAPSTVAPGDLPTPPVTPPRPLPGPATLYSHFSSSNRGHLLLQGVSSAALEQPAHHPPFLQLFQPGQTKGLRWLGRRDQPWRQAAPLDHQPDGPATLLPGGDGLVFPDENGLVVVSLPPLSPQRHLLPGNRDLKAFCGAGQRAVVLEHQPDYTKTIELLRPGLAPEVVWGGEAAILAVACDEAAERIWLLTVDGVLGDDGQPQQDILLVEVQPGHGVVAALHLTDHGPSATPTLHYDPVSHRLLTVLEHTGEARSEALLITLTAPDQQVPPQVTSINKPMDTAHWLVRS